LANSGVIGFGFENPAGEKKLLGKLLVPLLTEIRWHNDQDASFSFCPLLGENKSGLDGLSEPDFVGQKRPLGKR
jgi:hypothetical protein